MTIFSQDDVVWVKVLKTIGFVLFMIPVAAVALGIWLGATLLIVKGPEYILDLVLLLLKPLAQCLKLLYS